MHLEAKGKPVATICTTEFALLAHTEAEALGMAGLPLVIISHPFSDLSPAELPSRVAEAVDQTLRVLTTPSDALARDFAARNYPQPRGTVRAKALFA